MAETRVTVAEGPALVLGGYEGEPLTSLDAYRAAGGYAQLEAARTRDPQAVLDAFERELGIAPGETSTDGAFTLRAVECLGGCSTPTIVAVDHVYRQSVTPEDVPAIVAELGNE